MVVRCFALALLVACGGKYGGTAPAKPQPAANKRGIEAAGLPYSIVDARTGREVDMAAFWAKVDASRLVCVGEEHKNPHHHWVQLEVMKQVAAHRKHERLALGMEMFQRPFQGILDDYAASRIDEPTLLSRSAWEERWGYDYGLYGPTIRVAVAAHAALIALNAPKELVKKVVSKGLEGLTPDEKAQVPELDLENKVHRAWFDATMESMGGSTAHHHGGEEKNPDAPPMPSADRIYTAQVLWDETMADTAAKWLAATPNSAIVVLAGGGHCHDSAVVGRVKRRGIAEAISVQPVLDVEGRVADALAKPMNDYLVVLKLPAR
jgi:uncharacterized iron-regulated protein